jgi:hypothetical protein
MSTSPQARISSPTGRGWCWVLGAAVGTFALTMGMCWAVGRWRMRSLL